MGDMGERLQLRPLGIGEIFDRAVTLAVRNLAVLGTIGLVCSLPGSLASVLAMQLGLSPAVIVLRLVSLVLPLFGAMTVGAIVAQLYQSRAVDWIDAAKKALWNIPGSIGSSIMLALLFFLLPGGILGAMIPAVSRGGPAVAAAIVLVPIILAIFALGYIAAMIAMNSLVVEELGTGAATGKALSRLFAPGELGKGLLVGAVGLLVTYLGAIAGVAADMAAYQYLHVAVLGAASMVLVMTVASILSNMLASVYYFDIRIRREGYDLESSLDALEGASA